MLFLKKLNSSVNWLLQFTLPYSVIDAFKKQPFRNVLQIDFLKNFAIFTGKQRKENFLWNLRIFKSTFFTEHLRSLLLLFSSSHQRCSIIKGVLRNFTKFTKKHLCQSRFFKKETLAQVFSFEFCEISQNNFSTEYLSTTASGFSAVTTVFWGIKTMCKGNKMILVSISTRSLLSCHWNISRWCYESVNY